MAMSTVSRPRSAKVKLATGRCVNRVVKNITDNFNGTFTGEISMKGDTLLVTRRKHSRSWAVIS